MSLIRKMERMFQARSNRDKHVERDLMGVMTFKNAKHMRRWFYWHGQFLKGFSVQEKRPRRIGDKS
jgi:hypothetical protein